jgi:rhodanese-related sulfurtransferase
MKKNPFLKFVFISCFLSCSFAVTVVNGTNDGSTNAASASVQNLRKRNPALLISAETVFHKLKLRQEILLIDIRSREDFEKVRIPGSLNIPLYAVKTKNFLKSKQLVLVEEGFRYGRLVEECGRLREAGFKVFILNGGLNYWNRKKLPMEGDLFALGAFNKISPSSFFQERDFDHWVLIDISNPPGAIPDSFLPDVQQLPFTSEDKNDLADFVFKMGQLQDHHPSRVLVLFNEEGEVYEDVEKAIRLKDFPHIFFLEGGSKGVETFLIRKSLQQKTRDERLKISNDCQSCEQL